MNHGENIISVGRTTESKQVGHNLVPSLLSQISVVNPSLLSQISVVNPSFTGVEL